MELINSTRMVAGYTLGLEPSGHERLVVVVKGTFALPGATAPFRLSDTQAPLLTADVFSGDPGTSAPVYEMDFAPYKRRCDVLFAGSAYSPDGRPVTRLDVGLHVGAANKSFAVVGDRFWTVGAAGVGKTAAAPFTRKPISYDVAFGGVDDSHPDPAEHAAFAANPAGRGFHKHLTRNALEGRPLPNTEEFSRSIDSPDATDCQPMSFGPVGRGWIPRREHAGTYDEEWLRSRFPFLPDDFDDRYYQAAPPDQQIAPPEREELVWLQNLTPAGTLNFTLPVFDAPVHFFLRSGLREDARLILDTIVIEPDLSRFTLTWRVSRRLKRDIFEIAQVLVGKKGPEWWAVRESMQFPIPLVVVDNGDADAQDGGDETDDDAAEDAE